MDADSVSPIFLHKKSTRSLCTSEFYSLFPLKFDKIPHGRLVQVFDKVPPDRLDQKIKSTGIHLELYCMQFWSLYYRKDVEAFDLWNLEFGYKTHVGVGLFSLHFFWLARVPIWRAQVAL
eukprot:g31796.t1